MSSVVREQSMKGRIQPGDTFVVRRTFSEKDTMAFGDLIRDYNPIHYDTRFSEVKRFEGCVLHGLLTASMICETGGQLAWLASSMNFRFLRPVYFGDTIECRLTIDTIDHRGRATARATYTNQYGKTVLEAELGGILPGPKEREVLQKMVAEGDPTNKLSPAFKK